MSFADWSANASNMTFAHNTTTPINGAGSVSMTFNTGSGAKAVHAFKSDETQGRLLGRSRCIVRCNSASVNQNQGAGLVFFQSGTNLLSSATYYYAAISKATNAGLYLVRGNAAALINAQFNNAPGNVTSSHRTLQRSLFSVANGNLWALQVTWYKNTAIAPGTYFIVERGDQGDASFTSLAEIFRFYDNTATIPSTSVGEGIFAATNGVVVVGEGWNIDDFSFITI